MPSALAGFPGARFYKADLHMHTPASKCWKGRKDEGELTRIFETIKREGIEVVAITDHNSVASLDEAKHLGQQMGIHVFPGVEISTREGHVLAIFDPKMTTMSIEEWLIKIGFTKELRGDPAALAREADGDQLAITTVFELIEHEGGVAIAPHPNSKGTGFLEVMSQKGAARVAAYHSRCLRGLEVGTDKDKVLRFASGRASREYAKRYGCVASSDAHSLDEIGASFVYLKLGDFGIQALKQVFYDPDMRIRFADQWPLPSHALIESLQVSQGFFADTEFRFHPDMNCLVGGKATGKSLLLELIRFALGLESPIQGINAESSAKLRARDCLGDGGTVTLHIVTDSGERLRIQRTVSDLDRGPEVYYADTQTKTGKSAREVFPCGIYSQTEIIELGKTLPALIDWLDGFIDLSEERLQIDALEAQIQTSLVQLDREHAVASESAGLRKRKAELQDKKKLLEEKVKESILKEFPKWQKEERELGAFQEGLSSLKTEVLDRIEGVNIAEFIPEPEKETPNYAQILKHREQLLELRTSVQQAVAQLRKAFEQKQRALQTFLMEWRRRFDAAKKKHEAVITAAGVKNASALTSELDKTTEAIERVGKSLKRSEQAVRTKSTIEGTLKGKLLPDYNACYAGIYRKRLNKASEISEAL